MVEQNGVSSSAVQCSSAKNKNDFLNVFCIRAIATNGHSVDGKLCVTFGAGQACECNMC